MSDNVPNSKLAETSQDTGKTFNIKTAPLKGVHILEANAGTGKTFSLSGLYLKFLFNGTSITNLVAITYTKAAAEEIFKRVKGDLTKLIETLSQPAYKDKEPNLQSPTVYSFSNLLEEYAKLHEEKQQSIKAHLEKSLRNFDEHNIFTIHGFAHRIIERYQLELGLSGAKEVLTRDEYFFQEGFMDFWRKHITELHPLSLAVLEVYYPLKTLRKTLRKFYEQPKLLSYPILPDPQNITQKNTDLLSSYEHSYEQLKDIWNKIISAIPSQPDELAELKAEVKRLGENQMMNSILAKNYAKKFEYILTLFDLKNFDLFLRQEILFHKENSKQTTFKSSLFGRYTYSDFTKLVKKDFKETAHKDIPPQLINLFQLFDEFMKSIAPLYPILEEYIISVINLGIEHIRRTGKDLRKQSALLSFNDLLTDLEDNLIGNEELLQEIAQNYSVFLIDEFQDTDPIQFRIFSSLAPQVQAMYFIADPKQSIYGFRQANIDIYFQAKRQFPDILKLKQNYRATPQMVEAINFLYTHQQPFFTDALLYDPSSVEDTSANSTSNITLLINDPQTGDKKKDDSIRSIIPALKETLAEGVAANRIGILVRTRKQGKKILNLLNAHNIPAHTEGMDDLVDSTTALELYYLLKAIITTSKAGSTHAEFRAALTLDWVVAKKTTTPNLQIDESNALVRWTLFQTSLSKWSQNGIYVMLHDLLTKLDTATYLISMNRANILVELYDLIDLLKETEDLLIKEHILPSPENLLSNLASQIGYSGQEDYSNSSAKKGHSASTGLEKKTVVINTIHKSKGLEYEIVFLPYSDAGQSLKKSSGNIFNLNNLPGGDDNNAQAFDLRFLTGDEELNQENNITTSQTEEYALKDTLREELRLLYVGLTRAKRKLYLSLHLDSSYKKSALFYLLHLREGNNLEKLWKLFLSENKSDSPSLPLDELKQLIKSGNRSVENKMKEGINTSPSASPVFTYKIYEPEKNEVGNTDHDYNYNYDHDHEHHHTVVPNSNLNSSQPFPEFIPLSLKQIKSGGATTSFSSMSATIESESAITTHSTVFAANPKTVENYITNATNEKTIAVEQLDDETVKISAIDLAESQEHLDHPLLKLPAGAHTGLFFHELLEQANFNTTHQQVNEEGNFKLIRTTISKYFPPNDLALGRSGLSAKTLTDAIVEMLSTLGNTSLGKDLPALKDIYQNSINHSTTSETMTKSLWLPELDFNLYAEHSPDNLYTPIMNIINHDLGIRDIREAKSNINKSNIISSPTEYPTRYLDSYVRGFIDLVFSTSVSAPSANESRENHPRENHTNRYFILDWKSNFLGATLADYQASMLHHAMLTGNYYLQGYLYTTAIDRYLSNLDDNYSYKTHFGGFIYIFLRGYAFKDSNKFANPVIVHKPSLTAITKLRKLFNYGN